MSFWNLGPTVGVGKNLGMTIPPLTVIGRETQAATLPVTQSLGVVSQPFFLILVCVLSWPCLAQLTSSGPITITSANNGQTFQNLKITSTSGPCVHVTGASNITIQNVEVGPCGTDQTTSDSTGIEIDGGSANINVYDSYIHVENQASSCGDTHDDFYIHDNGTGAVTLQGNVIGYGEEDVKILNNSNVSLIGNYIFNPRGSTSCSAPSNAWGHPVQAWTYPPTVTNTNISYTGNYVYNSTDTTKFKFAGKANDFLSFGYTTGGTADHNWVGGTNLGIEPNSTGIIGDVQVNNIRITDNVVSDTYQTGIDIASGANHLISGNKVLIGSNGTVGTANAAGIAIVGSINSPYPCNTITVSNNMAYAHQSGGFIQGYYNDGYCTGVSLSGNTFDVGCKTGVNCTEYAALNTLVTTNPPPLIPPQPKNCVVTSPYTTQTGTPCNVVPASPPTGLTATVH
jgi:hypothetical protein